MSIEYSITLRDNVYRGQGKLPKDISLTKLAENAYKYDFESIQNLRRWAYYHVKPEHTVAGIVPIYRADSNKICGYIMKDREGLLPIYANNKQTTYIFDHKGKILPAKVEFKSVRKIIAKGYVH